MDLRAELELVRSRLSPGVLWRILQAAVAAGVSWELALQLPNHGRPFFAPIAAVIALGAEHGRRGKQAVEMMLGVAVGILVGAGIVAAAGVGWWQLVLGTLASLVITYAAGAGPLVRNQAAASTILIVALHQPGSNIAVQRLVDALVGGAVAIVLAQLLFPIDPVEHVLDETRRLRVRLADALARVGRALAARDVDDARAALADVDRIDERRVEGALALAREVVRRAPRRRRQRGLLEHLGLAAHELSAAVADAHSVASGGLRLLETDPGAAAEGAALAEALAGLVRSLDLEESRAWSERVADAVAVLDAAGDSIGAGAMTAAARELERHALRAAEARASARAL
ncbi:MAG: FUSC family protein [Actinobacteria bacterium]|nr:FUSC family protein [Actinomycetota bacterium]